MQPSKPYNYILSKFFGRRQRHAIYMTWQLVDLYGEDSIFMLGKEPSTRGELTEQILGTQELLYSRGVMQLASKLYTDNEKKTFKRNVTSRTKGGTIFRYINLLKQLKINFDLYSISCDELEGMLPKEFDYFLQSSKGN